ncbi:hypothetical protein [Amycolatopsis sp. NPDC000740]
MNEQRKVIYAERRRPRPR